MGLYLNYLESPMSFLYTLKLPLATEHLGVGTRACYSFHVGQGHFEAVEVASSVSWVREGQRIPA